MLRLFSRFRETHETSRHRRSGSGGGHSVKPLGRRFVRKENESLSVDRSDRVPLQGKIGKIYIDEYTDDGQKTKSFRY